MDDQVILSKEDAEGISTTLRQLLQAYSNVTKTWVVNKDSQWKTTNEESEKTFNEIILLMWEKDYAELNRQVNHSLATLIKE